MKMRLSQALPAASIIVALGVAIALVIFTLSGVTERKLPSHCTFGNLMAVGDAMEAIANLGLQSMDTAVRADEQFARRLEAPEGFVEERAYLNPADYYWTAASGFVDINALIEEAFNSCLETAKEVR